MYCTGLRTIRSSPRNRPVERPVHFEDTGSIAVSFELPSIILRNCVVPNRNHWARLYIKENETRIAHLGQGPDIRIGSQGAAERFKVRCERIRNSLRPATRD